MKLLKNLFLSKEEKAQIKAQEEARKKEQLNQLVAKLNYRFEYYIGKPLMSDRPVEMGAPIIFLGFGVYYDEEVGIRFKSKTDIEPNKNSIGSYNFWMLLNGQDGIVRHHQNWLRFVDDMKVVGFKISPIKRKVQNESN